MTTDTTNYEWALPLAVKRLNAEHTAMFGSNRHWSAANYDHHSVITVAKLIARYEQPHVDLVEEATARVVNAWHNVDLSTKWWAENSAGAFLRAAQAMREILAEVTRACPIPHTPNSETIEAMREILARGVKP